MMSYVPLDEEVGNYSASNSLSDKPTDIKLESAEVSAKNKMIVKIICKEMYFEIEGLEGSTTVAQLKKRIALKIDDAPEGSQRLIFNGKLLHPDDKTIASFSIVDKSVVHLFPRPSAVAVGDSSTSNGGLESSDPSRSQYQSTTLNAFTLGTNQTPGINLDIARSGREVKMWSSVLLMVSILTLFNSLATFSASGLSGEDVFDDVIKVSEAVIHKPYTQKEILSIFLMYSFAAPLVCMLVT